MTQSNLQSRVVKTVCGMCYIGCGVNVQVENGVVMSLNAAGGMEPYATRLEDFSALIRRDFERFGKVIKDVKVSLD